MPDLTLMVGFDPRRVYGMIKQGILETACCRSSCSSTHIAHSPQWEVANEPRQCILNATISQHSFGNFTSHRRVFAVPLKCPNIVEEVGAVNCRAFYWSECRAPPIW